MKDENKRTLYLKVRVSPEEMDAIKRKFQNSGMDTLSGFVRAMIFKGYIVQIDKADEQQIMPPTILTKSLFVRIAQAIFIQKILQKSKIWHIRLFSRCCFCKLG